MDTYARLQHAVSWDLIAKTNTNSAALVDVRASYIAIRAIEDRLCKLFSGHARAYEDYQHTSHLHQIKQLYINNAYNSILLGDKTYNEVRSVITALAHGLRRFRYSIECTGVVGVRSRTTAQVVLAGRAVGNDCAGQTALLVAL